jgi:hypothetical protein
MPWFTNTRCRNMHHDETRMKEWEVAHKIAMHVVKGRVMHVTGSGGPWASETSRFPHVVDNRLTNCGEVFSLKRRAPFTLRKGCAQTVGSRLPTAEDRVLALVRSCGICSGQCGTGADVLRVLLFPLPIIPPTAPHSSSFGPGTIGQTVANVPCGLSLTHPRKIHGTHFCYRLSILQGNSAAGRIDTIEKSIDLIGNLTWNLPACSIIPQPTQLPR